VQIPFVGEDFLSQYELLIDIKNQRLIDTVTSHKTEGELQHSSEFGISAVNETLQFHDLSQFMELTTTSSSRI
jgi:hypothetical protein